MNIAITGANSSVGIILLRHLAERADIQVVACVRSARAAADLPTSPGISVRAIDYGDREGLAAALTGTGCVVHLAGILFESPTSTYQTANVDATQAVVDACKKAGVPHVVLVSVLGADPDVDQSVLELERPRGAHRRRIRSLGRHHPHTDPAGTRHGGRPRDRPRGIATEGHAARRRPSFDPPAGRGRSEPRDPALL